MWRDSIRAWYKRNRRLIQGSWVAGSSSMLLLSIGSTFPTVFYDVKHGSNLVALFPHKRSCGIVIWFMDGAKHAQIPTNSAGVPPGTSGAGNCERVGRGNWLA